MAVKQTRTTPLPDPQLDRIPIARVGEDIATVGKAVTQLVNQAQDVRSRQITDNATDALNKSDTELLQVLETEKMEVEADIFSGLVKDSRDAGTPVTPELEGMFRLQSKAEAAQKQGVISSEELTMRNNQITDEYLSRYPGMAAEIVQASSVHNKYSEVSQRLKRIANQQADQAAFDLRNLEASLSYGESVLNIPRIEYYGDKAAYWAKYSKYSKDVAAIEASDRALTDLRNSGEYNSTIALKAIRKDMSSLINGAKQHGTAALTSAFGTGSLAEITSGIQNGTFTVDDVRLSLVVAEEQYLNDMRLLYDKTNDIPTAEWNAEIKGARDIFTAFKAQLSLPNVESNVEAAATILSVTPFVANIEENGNPFPLLYASEALADLNNAGVFQTGTAILSVGKAASDSIMATAGSEIAKMYGHSTKDNNLAPRSIENGVLPEGTSMVERLMYEGESLADALNIQQTHMRQLYTKMGGAGIGGPKGTPPDPLLGSGNGSAVYGVTSLDPLADEKMATAYALSFNDTYVYQKNLLAQKGELMPDSMLNTFLDQMSSDKFRESIKALPENLRGPVQTRATELFNMELKQIVNSDLPTLIEDFVNESGYGSNQYALLAGATPIGFPVQSSGLDADPRSAERAVKDMVLGRIDQGSGRVTFHVRKGFEETQGITRNYIDRAVTRLNTVMAPKLTKIVQAGAHINRNPDYGQSAGGIVAIFEPERWHMVIE